MVESKQIGPLNIQIMSTSDFAIQSQNTHTHTHTHKTQIVHSVLLFVHSETVGTIWDGEPRPSTSSFTHTHAHHRASYCNSVCLPVSAGVSTGQVSRESSTRTVSVDSFSHWVPSVRARFIPLCSSSHLFSSSQCVLFVHWLSQSLRLYRLVFPVRSIFNHFVVTAASFTWTGIPPKTW